MVPMALSGHGANHIVFNKNIFCFLGFYSIINDYLASIKDTLLGCNAIALYRYCTEKSIPYFVYLMLFKYLKISTGEA